MEIKNGHTAKEMLIEVDAAICKVLTGGQSYKIGTRAMTRADLGLLYKMKKDLAAQVDAQGESSLLDNAYVAVFEGR